MGALRFFSRLLKGMILVAICGILLSSGKVLAQDPDTSFSYVYVISNTPTYVHVSLNGQKFGELEFNQALRVKAYSQGPVKVLAYNPEGGEISCRIQMIKGNSIYCLVERLSFQEILPEMAKEHMDVIKSVVEAEEDKSNPIVKPEVEEIEEEVAEEPTEPEVVNDFSYINFINSTYVYFQIHINGRLIGTIARNENLRLKVYSEGRLSVSMLTDAARYITYLDVVNNEDYVMGVHTSGMARGLREKENGERLLEKVENTIRVSEDPYYPFLRNTEEGHASSQGTCFLINQNGHLLTNQHVVGSSEKVSIKGVNGDFDTWHEATVVGIDVDLDLALLKLVDESITFTSMPFQIKSTTVEQGEEAFVLGYPLTTAMGNEIKVTNGIISAGSGYKGSLSQYQFSAAIQPGNSGSPLFNKQGEVIGIINSKLRGAESAGYAIKSPYVHTFVNQVGGVKLAQIASSTTPVSLVEQVKRNKAFVFIVKVE